MHAALLNLQWLFKISLQYKKHTTSSGVLIFSKNSLLRYLPAHYYPNSFLMHLPGQTISCQFSKLKSYIHYSQVPLWPLPSSLSIHTFCIVLYFGFSISSYSPFLFYLKIKLTRKPNY